MTLGCEQGYASLRAGNEQFNPALRLSERLVSNDFQSQRLGVELQRNVRLRTGMLTNFIPRIMVLLLCEMCGA